MLSDRAKKNKMNHIMQVGISIVCFALFFAVLVLCIYPLFITVNYGLWIKGEEAKDYNYDGSVDNDDYVIYSDYQKWKRETKKDNNGSKKGKTIEEYYYHSRFEVWKSTAEAIDVNGDNVIDEKDLYYYENYHTLWGNYEITDFKYEGASFKLKKSGYHLYFLGDCLEQMSIKINYLGKLEYTIPLDGFKKLKEDKGTIKKILDAVRFEVNKNEVSINIKIKIEGTIIEKKLPLDKERNGYKAVIPLESNGKKASISFNVMRSVE